MAPWSLCQYAGADGGPVAAVLVEGRVRALPEGYPRSVLELLDAWPVWSERLRALAPATLDVIEGARLVAPITFPRKVLGSGANYYDHASEMGTEPPDPDDAPFFFLKPPTTTVIGPYDEIRVERLDDAWLDWEVELAVVIGERCRDVPLERARSVVAGYAVADDISARGRFARENPIFPPFAWDWLRHKGLDSSCPIGPGIVPSWLVAEPESLGLRLSVNGVSQQESSTSQMVAGIDRLVSMASSYVTLEPGDVILTGTPAGVGMPRRSFLHDGDLVEATIDGLGTIANRIVAV